MQAANAITKPRQAPLLRGACEKSARALASVIHRADRNKGSRIAQAELVASLASVFQRSAELLLAGKAVRIVEDEQALTTQQAADLLNVSRPHLVKLLETGEIAQLPKAGRHRRVARAKVLGYKRERDAEREAALAELAAVSQKHRLGH